MQNNTKLPYLENLGFEFFKQSGCAQCHKPPLFTDNQFYNLGIQGVNADAGHQVISQQAKHLGAMKTPSLRNVGLKTTFMHTGQFSDLDQVLDAYAQVPFKSIASKLPNGEQYNFQFTENQRKAIIAFLSKSLTDPRVQNETYPFDRPKLRHEQTTKAQIQPVKTLTTKLTKNGQIEIWWQFSQQQNGQDIEIIRNDGQHFWAANAPFIDTTTAAGQTYQYLIVARDQQLNKSSAQSISIQTPRNCHAWFKWICGL